jgi:hypothetical protein
MNLKSLSLPQRLGAGLGCVVVLALLAAAALYTAFSVIADRSEQTGLARAPRHWADSLRALARPIALTDLTLARSDGDDGAVVVYDSTQAWHAGSVEAAYKTLIAGAGATAGDSAVWRAVAADTALDRFVAAARKREWRALDHQLAHADSVVLRNVMALPVPHYAVIRNAARGLVIRGLWRAAHGDLTGARTDLGAATGLGEQVFRREPSAVGSIMGRTVILSGAHGWERFGTMTGDTTLVARARAVQAWASSPIGPASQLLILAPDTALALARDTTLVLGIRAEGMTDAMTAWLLRPRGFLFGPPGRYRDAMRTLEGGSDHDVARLAAMTRRTAERMNVFGLKALNREISGASR